MCGIAGYLGDFNPALLQEMNAAMPHRGPDGQGVWSHKKSGIGLAHRRLSIIDLSENAAQPMLCCEGRYVLSYNGEIYNFKELTDELKADYEINLDSDTSILAPLYHKYGTKMLGKLNGMFAFAIWDTQEKTLFIARDNLGIKPLYYTYTPAGFSFASELKTLLTVPNINKEICQKALKNYVTYIWSAGENTPFKHVKKLMPGHAILLKSGKKAEPFCWYKPPLAENSKLNFSKTNRDLQELLDKVVKEQCVADVPVGAFLSGGVDSSAIVASMVATGQKPKNTYCVTFHEGSMKDEGFSDDIKYARKIANHLGVTLTEVPANVNTMLDKLPSLVKTLEEPLADPAPLYVQQIAEVARADGIKVLLSGTGGDDVFSGYRRHQAAVLYNKIPSLVRSNLAGVEKFARPFLSKFQARRLSKLAYMYGGDENEFLMRAFEFTPRGNALNLFSNIELSTGSSKCQNALKTALRESEGKNLLNRLLYMELHGFLPDLNLLYTDKASMAASVEVRVPLLDKRLLEFAYDLPINLKINKGLTKVILREAVQNRLPEGILNRPKAGFGAPVRAWLTSAKGQEMVQDIIFNQTAKNRSIFNYNQLAKLWQQTKSNQIDGAYTVLSVLMIELWMREFLD